MTHYACRDTMATEGDGWRVEAIGSDGECYVTTFSGPLAEQRAKEYAAWKNSHQPEACDDGFGDPSAAARLCT